jgi:hypothetical protein
MLNSVETDLALCPRKDILRGALTDGDSWIFLILMLNPDGHGAKYRQSHPINSGFPKIVKPMPDVLTGILSHWVSG